MQPFEYVAPGSVDEAVELLAGHGPDAKLLAGGQSLLVLLRQRLVAPALVVDVKRIPALTGVAAGPDGGLRIGAATRHAELARSQPVRGGWPLLARAAGSIGSIHIRNRGTIGGSLAHADPAADEAVALIALDASIETAGPDATRSHPAEAFATGVFETVLAPDELVAAVHLPPAPAGATYGYVRFALREGEFPMCQAAVRLTWDGATCTGARVVVGGGAERPLRLQGAEAAVTSSAVSDSVVDAFEEQVAADVRPYPDVRGSADWKRRVLTAIAGRALRDAVAGRAA